MDLKQQASYLGMLVANLQSLEFALRAFLANDEILSGRQPSQSLNLDALSVGDIAPLNALTNYDTLSELVREYNNHPKISSANLTIDETLVDIRDAIAHGRVSSPTPSARFKLLRFSKPKRNDNQVKVVFSATMTEGWFKEQINRVRDAVLRVNEANEKLKNGML